MYSRQQKFSVFRLLATVALCLVLVVGSGCSNKALPIKGDNPTEVDFTSGLSDYPYIDSDTQDNPENPGLTDFPDTSHTPDIPVTPGAPDTTKPRALTAADVLALPARTVISPEQAAGLNFSECFVSFAISDEVFARINGKSFVENPHISIWELRYLKVLHYNYDHQIQVGELIVNASLATEFLDIFLELFNLEYEIYSMYLVDDIWTGDPLTTDDVSCELNNTSAFSYRIVPETGNLSKHAVGKAIDINPLQNPYVEYYGGAPWVLDPNSAPYIDRSAGHAHMITYTDDCYKVFAKRGYFWGGDWWGIKDYQHFEK